ncbi:hypothetical protein E2C01_066394 [Portunus trituberculatus]|uniref:Uncharacterized protein n=1 Tax=Portunus trituberculatus TaxID=210409 RepID=A0A5B7HGX8_PORTR|nr:hypothetical protein [Portunus trituberculatus]
MWLQGRRYHRTLTQATGGKRHQNEYSQGYRSSWYDSEGTQIGRYLTKDGGIVLVLSVVEVRGFDSRRFGVKV